MSDILSVILSFPPDKPVPQAEYDRQAVIYVKRINVIAPSAWRARHDGKTLFELLDSKRHSIAYIYLLVELIKTPGLDEARQLEALTMITDYLRTFDPIQIRYAGSQWRELYTLTAQKCLTLLVSDISPLSDALLRLDPSASTFTINHLTYLRLCMQRGTPSKALSILDKNIYTFPTATRTQTEDALLDDYETNNAYIAQKFDVLSKLSPEVILEYYLLGAHVYLGLRRWSRARLFLELIISHPSSHGSTSSLQVEAYRKWILVGLLARGRTYPHPRTTSAQVLKSVRAIAKPYDTLAEAFENRKWRKFQAEVAAGTNVWTSDGNLRLVNEAVSTLLRYCVSDLHKTYAALPVASVAAHLEMSHEQTSSLITDLIQQQGLQARVQSTGGQATLHFDVAEQHQLEHTTIEAQAKRIDELVKHIQEADRRLQLSKEYIDTVKRSKRSAVGEGDIADQMDLEYNAPVQPATVVQDEADEDIMA